jgi:hypothetical protein
MALSDTALRLLTQAGLHPLSLATPPKHLPAAACNVGLRSLLQGGYVGECLAPFDSIALGWRQQDCAGTALRALGSGNASFRHRDRCRGGREVEGVHSAARCAMRAAA